MKKLSNSIGGIVYCSTILKLHLPPADIQEEEYLEIGIKRFGEFGQLSLKLEAFILVEMKFTGVILKQLEINWVLLILVSWNVANIMSYGAKFTCFRKKVFRQLKILG